MNKQLSRIATFIESLPMESSVEGGIQTAVFSTELETVAGNNGGDCTNSSKDSCYNVTNKGDCTNYGVCGDSLNGGSCNNTKLPPGHVDQACG